MKIRYIKKNTSDYSNKKFTCNKDYEVIADYRKRQSRQAIDDNGFVIKDDSDNIQMVFQDDFIIIDKGIENTFVFDYLK